MAWARGVSIIGGKKQESGHAWRDRRASYTDANSQEGLIPMIYSLRFLLVGAAGLVTTFLICRSVLNSSQATPRRFALTVAVCLGILDFLLVLVSQPISMDSFILASILLVLTLIAGYASAYFAYHLLARWRKSSSQGEE